MKSKWKLIIGIIIIIFILGIGKYLFGHNEIPNDLYIKMNEINDNKSLIGLSEKEVIGILGEPWYKDTYDDNTMLYDYSAGKIIDKSLCGDLDGPKYYELRVWFNEEGKVYSTSIRQST